VPGITDVRMVSRHSPMRDESFPPSHRIRKRDEYRRVFERKRSVADQLLVVYACRTGFPHPRLGIAVSKKVGNAAVRNRWKRLIREAFRRNKGAFADGIDFVVLARAGKRPSHAAIAKSLTKLAGKIAKKVSD